ncbi:MAG: GFA family protein [Myxococcota bacterium]
MPSTIGGSCVCGAVKFQIEPPFVGFQYCHCSRCRKSSGSAHCANLFVPTDQLAWERGEAHVRRFELPGARYWCTAFCDECGSTMPWVSKTGKAFIVAAGALDKDPGVRPSKSVFHGSRADWYVDVSALEAYDTYPKG